MIIQLKNNTKNVNYDEIMSDLNIVFNHLNENRYYKFAFRRVMNQIQNEIIVINNGDNKIFKMLSCKYITF